MMIEANQFSICMMEVYTDFSTGLRKCFKMLDAGIASASMHTVSNGQVRVFWIHVYVKLPSIFAQQKC